MTHIIAIAHDHDTVTQLQHQIRCSQQLDTRTVDTRNGGMIAMAYVETTQSLAIALRASDHHTARDKVRRTFWSAETIVRHFAQDPKVFLVAFITDNTNRIFWIENSIGHHQFVGAIATYDTTDQHRIYRADIVQFAQGEHPIN